MNGLESFNFVLTQAINYVENKKMKALNSAPLHMKILLE